VTGVDAGLQDVFASVIAAILSPTAEAGLADQLGELPTKPGCYLFYNKRDELLYVGKALSLRNRVRSYFHKDQHRAPKIRRLVQQIHRIEWREVPTELHALTLECRLIKKHQPRFNALLKGDRRLPRLRVTVEETFPRVFMDWTEPNDRSRYFGPFTRSDSAEDLLDVLYRVFRLRSCDKEFTGKENMRPCLYYDLDQCLAPCNAKFCTPDEYREAVETAMEFLEGLQDSLVERLEGEMEEAAGALQFERAARLRDLRAAVLRWMERQNFMAAWEESSSGNLHLFFVRCAQLAGHCALAPEERHPGDPAWRLASRDGL
jgi:excinuclease ABC subunit C